MWCKTQLNLLIRPEAKYMDGWFEFSCYNTGKFLRMSKSFFEKWLIFSVKQLSNKNTCEVQCIYVTTKQPLHGHVESVKLKLSQIARVDLQFLILHLFSGLGVCFDMWISLKYSWGSLTFIWENHFFRN